MYEVFFQIDHGITIVDTTQAEVPLEVHFVTILKCLITDTKNLNVLCESYHDLCGNPFTLQKWSRGHCIGENEVLIYRHNPLPSILIYCLPFTSLSIHSFVLQKDFQSC